MATLSLKAIYGTARGDARGPSADRLLRAEQGFHFALRTRGGGLRLDSAILTLTNHEPMLVLDELSQQRVAVGFTVHDVNDSVGIRHSRMHLLHPSRPACMFGFHVGVELHPCFACVGGSAEAPDPRPHSQHAERSAIDAGSECEVSEEPPLGEFAVSAQTTQV